VKQDNFNRFNGGASSLVTKKYRKLSPRIIWGTGTENPKE